MKLATQKRSIRGAFTLPELLIVIAIIAVLATMVAGVLQSAQTDARRAATMSRITQIEAILRTELENFEVRRLPIQLAELRAYITVMGNGVTIPNSSSSPPEQVPTGIQVLNLRRQILQDYLNSEFPRPLLDSNGNTVFSSQLVGQFPTNAPPFDGADTFTSWLDTNYPNGFTLNSQMFPQLSQRLQSFPSSRIRSFQRIANRPDAEDFNLPGEYLYAILERIDIDGNSAIDLIGNSAIGNTDEDAFPEVIDAFGEPMQLRIWQIEAEQVGDSGAYVDQPNDFDARSADGIPLGFQTLDPTIPRELSKIRMEVVSTEL